MNKAWNDPGSTLNPTSTKELLVPRKPAFDETEWPNSLKLRLHPDAKYALIEQGDSFEIWDIEKGVPIGLTPACLSSDRCTRFDVETVRGRKGMVIAGVFCNRDSDLRSAQSSPFLWEKRGHIWYTFSPYSTIQISTFNTDQKEGEILLERTLPWSIYTGITIRGDFVAYWWTGEQVNLCSWISVMSR